MEPGLFEFEIVGDGTGLIVLTAYCVKLSPLRQRYGVVDWWCWYGC